MIDLNSFIRDIQDFPKPGILFKDITPLLAAPQAFEEVISRFTDFFASLGTDAIAGVESRGFIFAAPVALRLKKPLVLLRKPGKLPFETFSENYDLEYGSTSLHMHVDSVQSGQKIGLIDDVLATGGTIAASQKLLEKNGAVVSGCCFLLEIAALKGRDRLPSVNCQSLLVY